MKNTNTVESTQTCVITAGKINKITKFKEIFTVYSNLRALHKGFQWTMLVYNNNFIAYIKSLKIAFVIIF